MTTGYAIAYRLGLTPWERAGSAGAERFTALLAQEEAERTTPWGRALDLGCGTGIHTLELARRGWQVTGIDVTGEAVRRARDRARAELLDVRFLEGDVTTLCTEQVGNDVSLFLDVGCFHGLRDAQRVAMGECVATVAAPAATLLMLAFRPGRRRPLPRGASRNDIQTAFPGWTVVDEEAADVSGMPGPLRNAEPHWYRLRRG